MIYFVAVFNIRYSP